MSTKVKLPGSGAGSQGRWAISDLRLIAVCSSWLPDDRRRAGAQPLTANRLQKAKSRAVSCEVELLLSC